VWKVYTEPSTKGRRDGSVEGIHRAKALMPAIAEAPSVHRCGSRSLTSRVACVRVHAECNRKKGANGG